MINFNRPSDIKLAHITANTYAYCRGKDLYIVHKDNKKYHIFKAEVVGYLEEVGTLSEVKAYLAYL